MGEYCVIPSVCSKKYRHDCQSIWLCHGSSVRTRWVFDEYEYMKSACDSTCMYGLNNFVFGVDTERENLKSTSWLIVRLVQLVLKPLGRKIHLQYNEMVDYCSWFSRLTEEPEKLAAQESLNDNCPPVRSSLSSLLGVVISCSDCTDCFLGGCCCCCCWFCSLQVCGCWGATGSFWDEPSVSQEEAPLTDVVEISSKKSKLATASRSLSP